MPRDEKPEVDGTEDDWEDEEEDEEDDGDVSVRSEELDTLPIDPIFQSFCDRVIAEGKYVDTSEYLDREGIDAGWAVISKLLQLNKKLKTVIDGKHWADAGRLISVGGDTASKRAGWYANIVTAENDVRYIKMYVGQTRSLIRRLREHRRNIRLKKRSLHYSIAGGTGRKSNWILLGSVFERGKRPHAGFLNLVEMYFCLVFQTLPAKATRIPSCQRANPQVRDRTQRCEPAAAEHRRLAQGTRQAEGELRS